MSDYVGVSEAEEAEIIAEYGARTAPAGKALLATLFAQRSIPRGDEALTHVADLTTCLRAVAYRRRGVKPEPYTARELAKFAIGLGYEMEVAQTLRAAGHEVEQGLTVTVFGLDIGHPDLFVDGQVLTECKTTDGGENYPKSHPRSGQPKDVSVHHAIQASAYTFGVAELEMLDPESLKTVVLVKHAGIGDRGHEEVAHDVQPWRYLAQIEALAADVVALTGPEMPLPPAEPKPSTVVEYDECGYCRFRLCERNPNFEPQEIPA